MTTAAAALRRSDYEDLVRRALDEDVQGGDVTTLATVPEGAAGQGVLLAKTPLVVAGFDVAALVFTLVDSRVRARPRVRDGVSVTAGTIIGDVEGPARALLTGERVALNFLQRLSGVATMTRRFVDEARGRIEILDTRKTTPGLRVLEKYAVRVGGGRNHRMGLFDAFLIKDNHIRLGGGIASVVAAARSLRPDLPVEVEAQTLDEVDQALAAGVDILLIDNLSAEDARKAVARARGRAKTEISGGVTLDRIDAIAATGADFVSVGALTHSAPAADISFEIELVPAASHESRISRESRI